MTARPFVDQLGDVWSALVDLGHALTPADWTTPTECPGWSVQDHYAHVIGTESMLLGRATPPPAGGPHVHNELGEFNEAWVAPRRARTGPEIVEELEEVAAARLAALREMTDEQLEAIGPSPIGPVPYAVFMSVRVMDCWVHEQDVRQALGRPWRWTGPAAPAALDRLARSFGFVVGKRVAPAEGTLVVLEVVGPVPRQLTAIMRGGRAEPADGPDAEAPGVRMTVPGELYVRLATGRVDAPTALATGSIGTAGDDLLARAVLANLAQMP